MLSFPTQNNKFFFPDRPGVLKKTGSVTANQHIFKSGLTYLVTVFFFTFKCVNVYYGKEK